MAKYGGFDLSRLRVAFAVEANTNWVASAPMFYTLARFSVSSYTAVFPARTLSAVPAAGPADGVSPVGNFSAAGNATLDAARFVFYGATSAATMCPWSTTVTAPGSGQGNRGSVPYCTTNGTLPYVANRTAALVATYGQYMYSDVRAHASAPRARGCAGALPSCRRAPPLGGCETAGPGPSPVSYPTPPRHGPPRPNRPDPRPPPRPPPAVPQRPGALCREGGPERHVPGLLQRRASPGLSGAAAAE